MTRIQIDDIAELYFGMFSPEYIHIKEWGEIRYKRQVAIREMLINLALVILKQGFNLCIETGFDGPKADEHMQYYLESLKSYNTLFVGVECELEELEKREKLRGDRPIGLTRKQLEEGIHKNRPYDLIVDTSVYTPLYNAEVIIKELYSDK
jgi:chloramphenicol 3-O-phosphotransferase